ncbi:MAG: hypothetical protein IGS54_08240 [Elainella sp. C42_A2020_010]|nr:hypothetical protein [Elainella sp. C42_A2020_010]
MSRIVKQIGLAGSIVGLSISSLSCSLLGSLQSSSPIASPPANTPASTPTPIPAESSASVSPQPAVSQPASQPAKSTGPFTVLVAPPLQPTSTPSNREDYACLTANYFMNITWQQDQAKMTFGRKPTEPIFRDVMATVQANPDGSFTYAFTQAALFYTRVYQDRTCLIQVIEPVSNLVTLEEGGSLGMVLPIRTP